MSDTLLAVSGYPTTTPQALSWGVPVTLPEETWTRILMVLYNTADEQESEAAIWANHDAVQECLLRSHRVHDCYQQLADEIADAAQKERTHARETDE